MYRVCWHPVMTKWRNLQVSTWHVRNLKVSSRIRFNWEYAKVASSQALVTIILIFPKAFKITLCIMSSLSHLIFSLPPGSCQLYICLSACLKSHCKLEPNGLDVGQQFWGWLDWQTWAIRVLILLRVRSLGRGWEQLHPHLLLALERYS